MTDEPPLADRFLVLERTRTIDLATAEPVLLRVMRSNATKDPVRWSADRDALARVWHPWLAECLDHGALGEHAMFEAYRMRPVFAPRGRGLGQSHRACPTVVAAVQGFLSACDIDVVVECCAVPGGRLVVPCVVSDSREASPGVRGWPAGRRLLPREASTALLERFRDEPRPGAGWCDVMARPGSGGRTWLRQIAREGRRLGWVPVRLRLLMADADAALHARVLDAVKERHALVLHDSRGESRAASQAAVATVARLALLTSRPCVVVRLVDAGTPAFRYAAETRDAASVVRLELPPFTPAEQQSARVGPPGSRWRSTDAPRFGARRSGRRLATFLEPRDRGALRVRETQAAFDALPVVVPRPVLVKRADVSSIGRVADAHLARGRHAEAARLIRQAAAAAARRGDVAAAGHLLLAAGRLAARRGLVADAARLLDESSEALARGDAGPSLVECALARGSVALLSLDAGRSEALLRTALSAAEASGDRVLAQRARVALGNAMWWYGRFDEARGLALGFGPSPRVADDEDDVVEACALASRLALAERAIDEAARHVHRAASLAESGDADLRVRAAVVRARWLAVAGDAGSLRSHVMEWLPPARRARRVLDTVELRLLRVEGALYARATGELGAAARGLPHLAGRHVPPLVQARARLALAALTRRPDAERLRDMLVRSGFGAFGHSEAAGLALPPTGPSRGSPMLDDVLEMLRLCQDEEPKTALARVAELLRVRCSAALVAILTGGAAPLTISVPPARAAGGATRRALEAGLVIELHAADSGYEAAAPMRYGGALVGAVGCRWVSHPPGDAARVRRLLEAAAAAAGPCAGWLSAEPSASASGPEVAELAGSSHAIDAVRRAIARAAGAPFNVLIEGESGSGKELAARAIHRAGPRRNRPFCAVNGAALPDDLLEAELFGHARGAFTGAVTERRGLFEEADGGVLFLDEVGELSARAQAKLLRVLQEGEIRRLGEAHVRKVDVRLVTATNRALEGEVQAGRFRRDLFYRLAVIRIAMPPLRERAEDVPCLAAAIWGRAAVRVGSRAVLSAATVAALARYDWPGNVRELQNVLAALAVSAPRRGIVGPSALPAVIAREATAHVPVTLEEARRSFESRFVRAALARAGGHRGRAAADLGLTRQGLGKLLERLGVDPPDTTADDEAAEA